MSVPDARDPLHTMTTLTLPPEASDPRTATLRKLPEYEPDRPPAPPMTVPAPQPAQAGQQHASEPGGRPPQRPEIAHLLQVVLEVLNRRRPAAQLRDKLTPAAYAALCAALAEPEAPRGYRLRRFRLSQPSQHAVEVFGTVALGERTQALAARLDEAGGRWTCSTITVL